MLIKISCQSPKAAVDALRAMGSRQFIQQMVHDTYEDIQYGTDTTPVSLKDYMQVWSNLHRIRRNLSHSLDNNDVLVFIY